MTVGRAADVSIGDLAGDPHPHLARLRPVAWVPAIDGFLVAGRRAALEVLRDAETFTVDDPRFSTAQVVGPSMLSLDGPQHERHRSALAGVVRPRDMTDRFEAFVTAAVERRLDALSDRHRADLRAELAAPLAASVVAHMLGLDGHDDAVVDRLVGWYHAIVDSVSAISAGSPPTSAGAEAMDALSRHLRGHIARAGGLTTEAMVSNAAVVMFGGIETTEGMILNALWYLLTVPGVLQEVQQHPDLVAPVVEESLRLEPAASRVDRYATRRATVAGTDIGAGRLVVVSLAGANRDPEEFPEPNRFDLHRANGRRHLAFAAGPHLCLGMDVARLEARTAVTGVLRRLPDLRLTDDAPPPAGLVFRKPDRLPIHWG
jgi:cytochrome P450